MTSTSEPSPASQSHPAFHWLRSHNIASLQLEMHEFEHRRTGARHYHLAADNDENVFLVALRTLPMDSTGVAHILEHTALCGSEKYPVRDPFFMMIRRSLNTFMNAFTSSDCTAYPFASKNRKDFNNLLKVYMDAVFFSNLNELDFAQEGHRLAFSEDSDANSDLVYKGVVYNEMKGAMSSTTARLWQTFSSYLFPTSTYHYNSGGEPSHIPDLSYEQLKRFYETHYHPSNAIFMTYGNIPANELQTSFEELALKRFDRLPMTFSATDEKRYLSPVRVQESFAAEPDEQSTNSTHVVVGWLLGQSMQLDELFRAHLLSAVLLDNSASPLLAVLETSELGKSPSPLCGLEDSNREMSFICGLEGCADDATSAIEQLILSTLEKISEQGVDQRQIEAALHQLELSQREIAGDSYPYGLQLIMAGLSTAVHRGDPIKLLDIEPALSQLREDIKDPDFIPGLVRKLLLNNQHRVTLTLTPDSELATREKNAEAQRLAAIKEQLSDAEREQIIQLNARLAQRQLQQDDPDVLPKVSLQDVPAELPLITSEQHTLHNCPLTWYSQGTNGLVYQQIIVDLPDLEAELLEVLPWYTTCFTELGIGERDYTEVQTWQSAVCGGISCYTSARSAIDNEQEQKAVLVLSSKALADKHAEMTELLFETFFNTRLDENKRISELLEQVNARQQSSITGRGHTMAVSLASSGMSPTAQLSHQFSGLQGIKSLKSFLSAQSGVSITDLLSRFQQIHKRIIKAPRRFLLIGEATHRHDYIDALRNQWQGAPTIDNTQAGLSLAPVRQPVRALWTTNTQVNFCAKAYPTVPGGHADHPVLCVLAGVLRNAYLHRAVREQGGAYGAGADQDAGSASFRFYSYRDPRLSETLHDFDASVDWLLNLTDADHLVEEAILGVISGMDRSVSPSGAARQDYYNSLFGRTREKQMEFRNAVLKTRFADLKRVALKYLKPGNASIGVLSNTEQRAVAEQLGLAVNSI
ncbi:insulinase family protein [Pseudohongiella spirulinae]|uniref:Peptidase M16-like protein n=1 Tax=Pseudohongiella spirulinae TaxID=1249552 RepID=A0A0S2KDF8_9GAMM|nr:insulinase family protein [Pseudohongiella spirulinae]ALO46031.1 Peptidase M16-like protein [Pseudohongiella spirulinae]